jgi:hypothetical protein
MATKEKPNRFIETEPEIYMPVTPPKKQPKMIIVKGKKVVIDDEDSDSNKKASFLAK